MSKKNKPTNQLNFVFEKKTDDCSSIKKYSDSSQATTESNTSKVIYFDPRQEVYKKILNRQMK